MSRPLAFGFALISAALLWPLAPYCPRCAYVEFSLWMAGV